MAHVRLIPAAHFILAADVILSCLSYFATANGIRIMGCRLFSLPVISVLPIFINRIRPRTRRLQRCFLFFSVLAKGSVKAVSLNDAIIRHDVGKNTKEVGN